MTDLVLLVMNDRGIERLLQDKVTLGADASIAAGPVGRSGPAATDAQLSAEMLSYSRAHGLFAGIDLSGGVLRPDNDATRDFYGHSVTNREVLRGKATERIPATANPLMAALNGAHRSTAKHGVTRTAGASGEAPRFAAHASLTSLMRLGQRSRSERSPKRSPTADEHPERYNCPLELKNSVVPDDSKLS